jgi:hypothetical protein
MTCSGTLQEEDLLDFTQRTKDNPEEWENLKVGMQDRKPKP